MIKFVLSINYLGWQSINTSLSYSLYRQIGKLVSNYDKMVSIFYFEATCKFLSDKVELLNSEVFRKKDYTGLFKAEIPAHLSCRII